MAYSNNSSMSFGGHALHDIPISLSVITWRNSSALNIDHHPSVVKKIMWYRFLLIIVIFITALGNLLVCLAIARERKLQNTTNYFLMSLAIADCLVAILVMPMGMVSEVLGRFPLSHSACVIFATMDVLCCTSSIWHMSTMSMDRYFTIRFPFRYGRNKTRRIMLLKIIAVWAISVAISSPVFVLGIYDSKNVLSEDICAPNNVFFKIYGSIFAFYIPFVMMIISYALTMRSLRNVLVNKKKFDRERRQKQTFRPLAQIINQYAEIAQGLRRTSLTKKSILSPLLVNHHQQANKTPFTIITTTSPTDSSRAQQFFSLTNNHHHHANIHFPQENGSLNGTNTNQEGIHQNYQHLTISYNKPNGNHHHHRRRRYFQQQTNHSNINRTKTVLDMSTVYEITEYSKSTTSSYELSVILNPRRSTIKSERPILEQSQCSSPGANNIGMLKEEISLLSDFDSEADPQESFYLQNDSPESRHSSLSNSNEPIHLTIPWESCLQILQSISYYYMFVYPYRWRPYAIEYPRNSKLHQSTSTMSIDPKICKDYRTASTQTNSFSSMDLITTPSPPPPSKVNEPSIDPTPKRRKFPFNRSLLPTSSLLTNFFRHSSTSPARSSASSGKSSLSWGQHSSIASSSNQMRPLSSYGGTFRRMESEIEPIVPIDRRSRASTSSSCLLHTTYRQGNSSYTHYHKPLSRQHCYSRSAHVLANSPKTRGGHQPSSVTNTNSSDSSSVIHRYQSRLFSTVSNLQRTRDDAIVAANERKALRVLMIIFCVFVTLWTPFFICTFISAICEECRKRISPSVWFSITWLGYSSSMANPFVYTIFSDVFRRAFMDIIFCRTRDPFAFGHYSSKYQPARSDIRRMTHQPLSYRRSPNHEGSGASTPVQYHHPIQMRDSDGTVSINRYVADTLR